MKFFFLSASIILLTLIIIFPVFNLALYGDDWLALYRFNQMETYGYNEFSNLKINPLTEDRWNYFNYLFTLYGPQDLLMGFINKISGFQAEVYHLISFIFRMSAALSFYPLILYLTKNKLSSFFAVVFFALTVVGFDTTNWVFNMPSYLAVAFLNLFLYQFLIFKDHGQRKSLIFSTIFFGLAYMAAPIRMHGSIPFFIILSLYLIFIQKANNLLKKRLIITFICLLATFLLILIIGQSNSNGILENRFIPGLKEVAENLSSGKVLFLLNPVITFGSTLIPDLSLQFIQSGQTKDQLFLVMGGVTALLVIFLLTKFKLDKNLKLLLFISLIWIFLSFFAAWWSSVDTIYYTTHRYLIMTAMGVTYLLSGFLSLAKNSTQRFYILTILGILILANIISIRVYLNQLNSTHSKQISDKIWNSFPYIKEINEQKKIYIFFMEGDGINGGILRDTITFGFPPHMALIYNLKMGDPLPFAMSDPKELISAVSDGKSLAPYGYPAKPLSIEQIYSFKLIGNDNLINTTTQTRQKLQEIISERKN